MSAGIGYNHGGTMPPLTPAEAQVVAENERLVWFWVNRTGEPNEDERQEMYADGIFGLMRGAQKFDPSLGFRFSTYVMFWIRQAIQRGREQRGGANLRRAEHNGEEWRPTSLDKVLGDDDATLGDLLVADVCVEDLAMAESIRVEVRAWAETRPRFDQIDRDLIDWMLSGQDTLGMLTEIGNRHGVSREAVGRRRNQIREHLAAVLVPLD